MLVREEIVVLKQILVILIVHNLLDDADSFGFERCEAFLLLGPDQAVLLALFQQDVLFFQVLPSALPPLASSAI